MKHFILTLFLTILMSMDSLKASAGTLIDGINYILDDANLTATVTSKYPRYNGEIVIPASVINSNKIYSVTCIGEYAFSECSGLTSVTIPNGVTSIEKGALYYCTDLASVTIPNSVTSIKDWAFWGCSSLTSITIPNSVTSIGDAAFSGCPGLTSFTVSGGNTAYDSRDNCNAIIETARNRLCTGCKNTVIPNSVTSIEDWAFAGCSSLTSITIPNSVTSIENHAFQGCTGLTSITIPNSVKNIEYSAFSGCI